MLTFLRKMNKSMHTVSEKVMLRAVLRNMSVLDVGGESENPLLFQPQFVVPTKEWLASLYKEERKAFNKKKPAYIEVIVADHNELTDESYRMRVL